MLSTNGPKIEGVKELIKSERLFLNPYLSIEQVSEILDLSVTYFSRIFNQNSKESFTSYLNKLRVRHAKKLLLNKEYQNYTILAIGLESGFNSKSAFYRVFKNITGLNPTEFKKRNMS